METMAGKNALREINSKYGVPRATLYRWMRVFDVVKPWEKTYKSIVNRCGNNPLYREQGIKCRITVDELRQLWERDNAEAMEEPSIDRIDPAGDYVFHNCRYLEMRENGGRKRRGTIVGLPQGPHYNEDYSRLCREFIKKTGGLDPLARIFDVYRTTVARWAKGYRPTGTTRYILAQEIKKRMRQSGKRKT